MDAGSVAASDALHLGANRATIALRERVLRSRIGDCERNHPVRAAVCAPDRLVRIRPFHPDILQRQPSDLSMAGALRRQPGQCGDEPDEPGEHEGADNATTCGEEPHEGACKDGDLPRDMDLEAEGEG